MKNEREAPESRSPAAAKIDEALLARARAGDRAALTELYEASSLELYRSLHAMLRDEELVLDVQQDTYLKAFSRLDQLRDAASFLPWLRKIAVNEARAQLRRKRPLLFSELTEEEAGEPELPDQRVEAAPELALDRAETARLIREILEGLTDAQRLMLGMYYYEQIPVKEIAESLNLSQSTVKTQLRRSKKRVETEVRRLEAQGVKLYGLSPLPFLLALLKRAKPDPGAGEKLLAGALPRAAEAAAEAAAVHVGRSFFQTALGRVCLGLLAATALGGGVLGYSWLRSQTTMGDVQPTEPIQILHTVEVPDSDEDLPSAETELPDFTEPDTPEELPEPSTEATEPPTEPEPSEPAAIPTEPEPTEPENQPPAPTPTQPATPVSPTPTPTEPTPNEPSVTQPQREPQITGYSWPFEENAYDLPSLSYQYAFGYVKISTINGGAPTLYTDNPAVVKIEAQGKYTDSDLKPGETGYCWRISVVGSGNARIFCTLKGEIYREFTITNPEHPPKLLRAELSQEADAYGQLNCQTGESLWFSLVVQGESEPEISTDRPEVIRLGPLSGFTGGGIEHWYEHGFFVNSSIVGAGDAHIYVKLNGETVKTYSVHAADRDEIDPSEETDQTENPAQP